MCAKSSQLLVIDGQDVQRDVDKGGVFHGIP